MKKEKVLKDSIIKLRVTPKEKEEMRKLSAAMRKTISGYVRDLHFREKQKRK